MERPSRRSTARWIAPTCSGIFASVKISRTAPEISPMRHGGGGGWLGTLTDSRSSFWRSAFKLAS